MIDRETGRDLSGLLARLAEIKKSLFSVEDAFWGSADDAQGVAVLERFGPERHCVGVFSLRGEDAVPEVPLEDGDYVNHIDGSLVVVRGGKLHVAGMPLILSAPRV